MTKKRKEELTLTCPAGHTYPMSEFHSYVDMNVLETENSITFYCPRGANGHGFSLRRAVGSGMLTIEQASRICTEAEMLRRKDAKK